MANAGAGEGARLLVGTIPCGAEGAVAPYAQTAVLHMTLEEWAKRILPQAAVEGARLLTEPALEMFPRPRPWWRFWAPKPAVVKIVILNPGVPK